MNKEVVVIGGGIVGGMLSNGASTLLPQSENPLMNLVLAGVSAFGATKVSGINTKDNLLRGALIGSAVVQTLIAVRKVSEKHLSSKFTGTGKGSLFAKGVVGLACPDGEGLNGQFMGGDGHIYEYDEQGLNGTFIDEAGNIFHDEGLNGEYEELYEEQDGLNGAEADVYGEEDHGLNGVNEHELYEELYQ
ncbi:hypothetical protein ACHRV5_14725 [Flavobacterium sp. FlaQc-52]|uniref:hypothetical protein n=1 Tax=Flavobacterium sp. FlaQc-52 TaxID=3374185 RepID=UPI003757514A